MLCAANIPMYIYPFLGTKSKEKPYEYLRLSSLGVIGALVKVYVWNYAYAFNPIFIPFYFWTI